MNEIVAELIAAGRVRPPSPAGPLPRPAGPVSPDEAGDQLEDLRADERY